MMKISSIIAVRDTRHYLDECLGSVLSQTHSNLEVWAVDDRSTDGSLELLRSYAARDARLRVLMTSGAGASTARNLALERCSGDWIAFLDSDDVLPPDAYERLARRAAPGVDVVTGIARSFKGERRWLNEQMQELSFNIGPPRPLARIPALGRDASPCNKLIRASLVHEASLRFPESIGVREDLHFVLRAYAHARAIHVVPDIVYHYRLRDTGGPSLTQHRSAKSVRDLMWVARDLDERIGSTLDAVVRRVFLRGIIGNILYRIRDAADEAGVAADALLSEVGDFVRSLDEADVRSVGTAADCLLLTLLRRGEIHHARWLLDADVVDANLGERLDVDHALDTEAARLLIHAQEDRIRSAESLRVRAEREVPSLDSAKARVQKRVRSAGLARAREMKLTAARRLRRFESPRSRPVWVVGERRGEGADDTGFHFFRHLQRARPDIESYFVTSRATARTLGDLSNVLEMGDLSVVRALLRADAVVYSDSGRDLYRHWPRIREHLRPDVVGCFLQHGVIALHGMRGYYHRERMLERSEVVDVFVVSSETEKSLVVDDLGHPSEHVAVTGLSRFDDHSLNATVAQEVLVAPTWRHWIRGGGSSHLRAEYVRPWARLLADPRVHEALARTRHRVVFAPHFAARALFRAAIPASPWVRIASERESTTELVRQAHALVTDYSSVAFDFAYRRRATLFYMFDDTKFYSTNGSLALPLEKLPGPVARHHDEIVRSVLELAECDWNPAPTFLDNGSCFFAFRDQANCARISAAIEGASIRARLRGPR